MAKGIKKIYAFAMFVFALSIGVSLLLGASAYPIPNDAAETASTTTSWWETDTTMWETTDWETSWPVVTMPPPAIDFTIFGIVFLILIGLGLFLWFLVF